MRIIKVKISNPATGRYRDTTDICENLLLWRDNSTYKYYCTMFVIFESQIPRRFAPGIVRLTLQTSLRSFSESLTKFGLALMYYS